LGLCESSFYTLQQCPTFALENNGANACVTSGPFKAIQIQNRKHHYWVLGESAEGIGLDAAKSLQRQESIRAKL